MKKTILLFPIAIAACVDEATALEASAEDAAAPIPRDLPDDPPNLFRTPIHRYPAGWDFGNPSPWEAITGDFNGDGRTDYARLGGTYAHLFFSTGGDNFVAPIHYYPDGWDFGLPSPWETITGDFNGDRRTDYARLGGTASHIFLSKGDGTFATPVQMYPAGWDFGLDAAWPAITGDFNGDGKTDYARLGGTYSHFFFSNGDGTFSAPVHYYPAGWNFGNPGRWETIVGDFNDDGRTDYGRLGGRYSHLFFSNGDGTFVATVHDYPVGWDFGFDAAWPAIVGDFDGDGKDDYGRLGGTASHFFLARGDGTFSAPVQRYPTGWDFGNPGPWETIVGDFDADGKTDYGRLGSTYSHFFYSDGGGQFAAAVEYYPPGWSFGFDPSWPAIVGDWNGDGRTDYLRLGGTYSHVFIAR